MNFKDHFSSQADHYRVYRPGYPGALYSHIAQQAESHRLAWDCATGNGQAAVMLTPFFDRVVASDASDAQIQQAIDNEHIEYRVMPAEHTDLADTSVDLISVAQALHWFDIAAFFREARRVLKPGGVLAVWCYQNLSVEPEIDAIINLLYADTLADYWPAERKLVENAYHDIMFPFSQMQPVRFSMRADWTLTQLLGYLDTWSATRAFARATGKDPVAALADPLRRYWGAGGQIRQVTWPVILRLGRHNN